MTMATSQLTLVDDEPGVPKTGARSRTSETISGREIVRIPVNALAIVPKTNRITALGRKAWVVLLYLAQDQGIGHEQYRAPLNRVLTGLAFDSNDHALVKRHLRAMVSTTVEWQSPTVGEGASWDVCGLLAHASLTKERGEVWLTWSYAVNLRQELMDPKVFARTPPSILVQLRSHAAIVLYEICTRYKDIGRTSRKPWRWWRPVLSGQPDSESTAKLEYRIFKRDTLKLAIAEVSALTDIDVELVEYKEGRFIGDIQFSVKKKNASHSQAQASEKKILSAVDVAELQPLAARAERQGISDERIEDLFVEYGASALGEAMTALERRMATPFPEPIRDAYRYLRTLLAGKSEKDIAEQITEHARAEKPKVTKELPSKRQARWAEEWARRKREKMVREIEALSDEQQQELSGELLANMVARGTHPSICKRLQSHGWKHPMVLQEMLKFYAAGAHGEEWDQPSTDDLLEIAAELGDEEGTSKKE